MDQYLTKFKSHLDQFVKALPAQASNKMEFFALQLFDKMPLPELETLDADYAANIASGAYDFIQARTPHRPKIRILSPESEGYGWQSENTIVEILNDDMPFLVDSVMAELARHDLTVERVIHPVLRVKRDSHGTLLEVKERGDSVQQKQENDGAANESLMHIELTSLPEDVTILQLTRDLERVLQAVEFAVSDWKTMLQKLDESFALIEKNTRFTDAETAEETKAYLHWLNNNNFIFLGYMEYSFSDDAKAPISVVEGSELGLFRMDDIHLKPKALSQLPKEVIQFARQPRLLELTKANMKSPVHRPVHMDYVALKRFNDKGEVVGENRFVGMFTSRVYHQSTDEIPILRRKIARVMERANFDSVSHNGKALKAIMEFLPRDEILQYGESELFDTTMGILSLDGRPDVRLFPRIDLFERFVSFLLYVPRDRFSTFLREKIQTILELAYNGQTTAYYTQVSDSSVARVHIILNTTPGQIPAVNVREVEADISKVTNLWSDTLLSALVEQYGRKKADTLFRVYKNAFPANYITHYNSSSAVYDIQKIDEAVTADNISLDLFRKTSDADDIVRLKVYNPHKQMPLSDILPMLENMGFRVLDENPYPIAPKGEEGKVVWVRDLRLAPPQITGEHALKTKVLFEEALNKVWLGHMENDAFNALTVKANLAWREVVLLRAYAKYLKQVGLNYSHDFLAQALLNHPEVARLLVAYFDKRFNPDAPAAEKELAKARDSISTYLVNVTNSAEDKVIRRYLNAMESTLRTNFFQTTEEGKVKDYISFKFDSKALEELPLPRPFREIFVYSMRTEGIHLRGGKVARGGLRWSDRPEDFRTEVLGLVKAQMVKNAIIVPVGSKGGFVVKQPTASREEYMKEGVACYQTFLRGLLDVTDNIVEGAIVPPTRVVRHDEDDPYLVVAADKGTATFSDYANGISKEYGFWLRDAFASGGSAGYDHKKMGITARGAWVSVTSHFRQMGVDVAKEDFTVVGIGDMAGDVFGNGMLLSKHIRLVAAFNHMHIFIDPTPDAASGFTERERLFNLPRSTWADYDTKLISKGGGIFARSEKTIPVSEEARVALGLAEGITQLAPDALIQAILKAPVDLLWNGGIGTYVKARTESHDEVGDRANNGLRINGEDLRCKVVGEGGNLGFTQRGRIEYARKGGRINTDALDNSAGVDCSDHEVNIKIALAAALEKGSLTLETRDKFLAEMTDEVAHLVLRDNQLQNQALTNAETQGHRILESRARLMTAMEKTGLLNRTIEYLPSNEEIAERRAKKQGFTRPELAVILAYSKLSLYEEILHSQLPDDAYFRKDLLEYFPVPMQKQFSEEIEGHALRREIIATVITNSMINWVGAAFFNEMAADAGVRSCDVARAFAIARDAFGLSELWASIEGLAGKVSTEAQAAMFVEINEFVRRITGWFLRNYPQPINISEAMQSFGPGIASFVTEAANLAPPALKQDYERKRDHYLEQGVPEAIAARIASLDILAAASDVVRVAVETKLSIREVGAIYFRLGEKLNLGWLRIAAEKLTIDSHWDRIAVSSIINDLSDHQRRLAQEIIRHHKGEKAETAVDAWLQGNTSAVERLMQCMNDIRTAEVLDFPMLVVAMRNVELLTSTKA